MELLSVPATHIDIAWKDGAHALSEACDACDGEITPDQLKMILSRGERTLLQMRIEGEIVGWAVIRIDQLPNLRALHVTGLVAHNGHFELFVDELGKLAHANGCSRIRCSAKPAQARLYSMKCGFKPVYTTLEIPI